MISTEIRIRLAYAAVAILLLIKYNNGTSGTTDFIVVLLQATYRSFSGLLTGESVNAMHVGVPSFS